VNSAASQRDQWCRPNLLPGKVKDNNRREGRTSSALFGPTRVGDGHAGAQSSGVIWGNLWITPQGDSLSVQKPPTARRNPKWRGGRGEGSRSLGEGPVYPVRVVSDDPTGDKPTYLPMGEAKRASGWDVVVVIGSRAPPLKREVSKTGNPFGDHVFLGRCKMRWRIKGGRDGAAVDRRLKPWDRRRRRHLTVHLKPYWGGKGNKPARYGNLRGGGEGKFRGSIELARAGPPSLTPERFSKGLRIGLSFKAEKTFTGF